MLDIRMILEETEKVKTGLLKRMKPEDLNLESIIEIYNQQKAKQQEFEQARAEQNKFNDKMSNVEKGGEEFKKMLEELKSLSDKVKTLEEEAKKLQDELTAKVEVLPNVPDEDLVAGEKEANVVIKTHKEKRTFDFKPKDHLEIASELGLLDFEKAAKMSGTQFTMYKGWGARLEWALINFFIAEHNAAGYTMIMPPHMVTADTAYAAGQLPKFKDDVYWVQDGYCMIPTAETALTGYLKDEIVSEDMLPIKLFAYTPCYRREAGSYRANERGLMRMHQFNKVEMYQYTTDEQSDSALEELLGRAEMIVEKLGLHYRTSKLAAGDCGACAAKTFDVEVHLPVLDTYYEVSSISNVRDYQARRGNMRFKPTDGGKPRYMHTLNASGLATSRLMVALIETYQNEDGSLTVPEALRPFIGVDKIEKLG